MVIVFLLVLNDLEGDFLFALVVKALYSDTERPFAKETKNFVPVRYMVVIRDSVVTLAVVEAKIRVIVVTVPTGAIALGLGSW